MRGPGSAARAPLLTLTPQQWANTSMSHAHPHPDEPLWQIRDAGTSLISHSRGARSEKPPATEAPGRRHASL